MLLCSKSTNEVMVVNGYLRCGSYFDRDFDNRERLISDLVYILATKQFYRQKVLKSI